MKRVIAALMFLVSAVAGAQTQVSTAGNFGNLQEYASSGEVSCTVTVPAGTGCFAFVDQMNLPVYSYGPPTLIVHVLGQNGGYSCGRACSGVNTTTFPSAPTLWTAQPAVDSSGHPVMIQGYCALSPCTLQEWNDVAPATDVNGAPITFVKSGSGWQLNATTLPAGNYTLHFAGTSCAGRYCQLPDATRVYVSTTVTYPTPPPPPPCDSCD